MFSISPTATSSSTATADKIAALEALLTEETQTYRLVADVLTQKQTLLVEGNHQGLTQADRQLVGLGQKSLQLEQQRITLMQLLGQENSTLAEFIEQLPSSERQKSLTEARARLRQIIEQVHHLNQTNKRLIISSLKWIEQTMTAVTSAVAPEATSYNAYGDKFQNKKHASNPIQSTFIRDV